jgi:glutamate-5-semialdehyde dehydrogenase
MPEGPAAGDGVGAPPLDELGRRSVAAAGVVALASTAQKDEALRQAADLLGDRSGDILTANARDVERAQAAGGSATAVDRLRLSVDRLQAMADSLRTVAGLPDPVGEVVEGHVRPNGLRVERVRVPLGVVGVIYENRPNVTSDAAALCLKAGNAALLRGSSGTLESNKAVAGALRDGAVKAGLPADVVLLVEDTRHATAEEFVQLRGTIDCLIPRGGTALIQMILEKATVPYVLDGDGNCHVYVDRAADLDMAERIVVNAKTQRPSVCNAAESLVIHTDVADAFLPRLAARLAAAGVELVGDARSRALVPAIGTATDEDFAREYLDLKASVAVVDDLDAAIAHIARYGSGHSEAIVTGDLGAAQRFVREVDAAAVVVNASTRFVDGGELGLGAEVGISTQKLHARGPMGLQALTSVKYVVYGEGQVRT